MAKIGISGFEDTVKNAVSAIANKVGNQTVGNSTGTGPQVVGNIVPNKVAVNTAPTAPTTPTAPVTPTNTGANAGAGINKTVQNAAQNVAQNVAQQSSSKNALGSLISSISGFTAVNDIIGKLLGKGQKQAAGTAQNVSGAGTSTEGKAETSIGDLKNKYAQNLRDQYDYSAKKLREERDAALRENWVLQQQAEAALPEQMAAAGINGGASETTLANLRAKYQGDRNNIRGEYMNNLGELSQQSQSERAEAERAYNEKWLEYLLSLAKMEAAKELE